MNIFLTCLAFMWITNRTHVLTAPTLSTMGYLQRYGYMQGESSNNMAQALVNFQKMMHMKPTGIMDKETSEAMHKPRCGMADMLNKNKNKAGRWNKEKLTYRVLNAANPERTHISPNNTRQALIDAFKIWSDQTNLEFIPVGKNEVEVDIDIIFAKGRHKDGDVAFDGPAPQGIELAHAGYPTLEDRDLAGDVHFDDDEVWVLKPRKEDFSDKEFNFLYVAVHEIGHALGLRHSNNGEIMGPMYMNTTDVQLKPNDIKSIQELYGPPRSKLRVGARFLGSDICEDPEIDAAFSTVDGSTYVIKEQNYWKLTGTGLDRGAYPIKFGGMWVNGPSKVDAAFTNIGKDKTFFVQGSQVWRYSQYKHDMRGDLKSVFRIVDLDSVDAILKGDDRQPTYFFKGNMFRKKVGLSISSGFIADVFKGVPSDLDAAVMYKRKDNQPADPVFFKGDKCYYRRYTPSSPGKDAQFTKEYVQAETKVLFGCPR